MSAQSEFACRVNCEQSAVAEKRTASEAEKMVRSMTRPSGVVRGSRNELMAFMHKRKCVGYGDLAVKKPRKLPSFSRSCASSLTRAKKARMSGSCRVALGLVSSNHD